MNTSNTRVNQEKCAKKDIVSIRLAERAERESKQRYAAKQRYRAVRKSIPKEQRARDVRAEQKARFLMESSAMAHVEEQGPADLIFKGLSTAGTLLAGVGVFRFMNEGRRSMQILSKEVTRLSSGAEDVTSSVRETNDKVTGILDTIHQQIKAFASSVEKVIGSLWIIPTVIMAHALISSFIHVPLLPMLCGSILVKVFGPQLWELISGYFRPQEQSAASVANIGALICTVACTLMIPLKSVSFAAGEVLKRIGGFDRGRDGFESFFGCAIKYAEKAINCIFRLFGKDEVAWIDKSDRLVDAFVKKVDDFERLTRGPDGTPSIEVLLETVDSQLEAIGLKATVRDARLLYKLEKAISKLSVLLIPYQGSITAARNFRAEPVFMCFYGESAVGKTSLVTKLATTILVKSGLCKWDTALQNLWQKGSTEYWNGYVNQKCLIMDDCFQVKPKGGETDSEYMQVIRMIGNWAYALNFADLESKGKFYFDTPLVIGTTNCANINIEAGVVINKPEAVVRRIKHPYEIKVSEGFTREGGKLDYIVVDNLFNNNLEALRRKGGADADSFLECFPWEAWTLKRHDFTNPQVGGEERSVRSLIDEIVADLKNGLTSHTKAVNNLEYFLKGIAGECVPQSGADSVSNPAISESGSSTVPLTLATMIGENTGVPQQLAHSSWGFSSLSEDQEAVLCQLDQCDSPRVGRPDDHIPYMERMATLYKETQPRRDKFIEYLAANPALRAFISIGSGFLCGYVTITFAKVAIDLLVKLAGAVVSSVKSVASMLFGSRKEQSNVKNAGIPRKVHFKGPSLSGGLSKVEISDNTRARPPMDLEIQDGCHEDGRIQRYIYENTFKMFVEYHNGHLVEYGQVQLFDLDFAAQPKHFRRTLWKDIESNKVSESSRVHFEHPVDDRKVTMTVKAYMDIVSVKAPDRDVEFFRFPKGSLLGTRTITQYLLSDEQYEKVLKAMPAVRLDVATFDEVKGKTIKRNHTMTANSFKFLPNVSASGYDNRDLLSYNMPTEFGMCGAPLTISDNRHYGGRCYLGFHVAGSSGIFGRQGMSNIITAEMVEYARKRLNAYLDKSTEDAAARCFPIHAVSVEEQAGLVGPGSHISGSFNLIGKVDKGVSLSPYTKLKLSPIGQRQPFGPNPQRPAILKSFVDGAGNVVYPMVEGLAAYKSPLEFLEVPNIEAAIAMATRPFRQLSTGDYRGIFTKEEACSGIEGLKIKALNRATSAGYPYVLDVKNGKKEFFGANDEFYYESEKCIELFDRVDYVVESAKKGERLMHVFVDFLKDETRPHAKVDAGATRCISSAPLDYVIAWRMYFGAFMASMFKHHTDSGMCPGINPYNEWWRLAANLSRHGERTFDGDFKRFDSSEQPSLHWRILDFVNRWYDDGPENARVREILWYDLVHSRHLGGLGTDQKYLYQWNKALPSGHPFTTPVNSLYSLITLTACYVDATGDMMNMWDHVYIATFGDDNITNVDAATSEIFNQETVCASMKRLFNLTYTSGRKDGKIVPYTTLGECTFLKRTFTRDDLGSGGWLAPLDPASFLYTSYYYRNTRDARGDMLTNLESGLGELAFHSVEMWDKYYPLFKQTIAEAGEVPAFETREAYREMLRARTDAWF